MAASDPPAAKSSEASGSAAEAKRIKRLVHGVRHRVLVRHPRAFGAECAAEVAAVVAAPLHEKEGGEAATSKAGEDGVAIEGLAFREMLALPARLTTATRLEWVVHQASAPGKGRLIRALADWPLELYLPEGATVTLRVSSTGSHVFHEGGIKELVAARLAERRISVAARAEDPGAQGVDVRLHRDVLTIALDLGGEALAHRGYKKVLRAAAPLREDLAACIVRAALASARFAAKPDRIVVPFAGSGTFGFEALLALHEVPPSAFGRTYAADGFVCTPAPSMAWMRRALIERARAAQIAGGGLAETAVRFVENDAETAEGLEQNAAAFIDTLAEHAMATPTLVNHRRDTFEPALAEELTRGAQRGVFLLMNPPYGHRLAAAAGLGEALGQLVRRVATTGDAARLPFAGAALVPDESAVKALTRAASGLDVTALPFRNGGLKVQLVLFRRATS